MKALKWIGIIVAALILIAVIGMPIAKNQTKKHSPEQTAEFKDGSMEMSLFYCSPAKNGREIFGGLVPYEEVWRTGANEASTITFNKEIVFDGVVVPAGTYAIFTIPGEADWTVILNSKEYGWGLNFDQTSPREPEFDVAVVNAAVMPLDEVVENFTMDLEYMVNLTMAWDKVKISVPIAYEP